MRRKTKILMRKGDCEGKSKRKESERWIKKRGRAKKNEKGTARGDEGKR